MSVEEVRLVRGEATVRSLSGALDELGVSSGDEFVIGHGRGRTRRTAPAVSHKAAWDNYPRQGSQRERALRAILAAGDAGMTSEEVSVETGIPFARSLGPRLNELKLGGWIQPNGDTRTGSLGSEMDVLVPTDKALDA